jgi:cytochrome c553
MIRPLRFLLSVVALFVAAIALLFSIAWWLGDRKFQRTVEVRVVPVAAARDPASLKHGKYLFESRGCLHCHGRDGAGAVVVDDPGGLYVKGPNITAGPGGVVSAYSDGDWVRAIRHGVDPKGHALLVMPSDDYNRMTDADLAALIGYVKGLPPARGEPAVIRLPAFAKALYGIGGLRDAAEKIDHRRPPPVPVPVGPNAEHGEYVAAMCMGCHGAQFGGGPIPGAPPTWPAAANLTPGEGSTMARYDTVEKFIDMMRTGKRPDGSEVSRAMPFDSLAMLSDVDLQAMYAFLRTLPPRSAGRR